MSDIIDKGFIVKENRCHWLGNGIYFFADEALAKWWTTRPTRKFGHSISSPVILRCALDVPERAVLDLRKFDAYTYCFDMFKNFYNNMYRPYCTMDEIDINKLRCSFFDWLFDIKKYAAIIGTFSSGEQPYYQTIRQSGSYFDQLNLTYSEVQICVSESYQQNIKHTNQTEVAGGVRP